MKLSFEEWQEQVWYGSGRGYEGCGLSTDHQYELYIQDLENSIYVIDNRQANATPNRHWDYTAVWEDEKDDGPDISEWAHGATPKEAIKNFINNL